MIILYSVSSMNYNNVFILVVFQVITTMATVQRAYRPKLTEPSLMISGRCRRLIIARHSKSHLAVLSLSSLLIPLHSPRVSTSAAMKMGELIYICCAATKLIEKETILILIAFSNFLEEFPQTFKLRVYKTN